MAQKFNIEKEEFKKLLKAGITFKIGIGFSLIHDTKAHYQVPLWRCMQNCHYNTIWLNSVQQLHVFQIMAHIKYISVDVGQHLLWLQSYIHIHWWYPHHFGQQKNSLQAPWSSSKKLSEYDLKIFLSKCLFSADVCILYSIHMAEKI